MKPKHSALLCLILALCLCLSSCAGSGVPTEPAAETTLPPARVDAVAPIGDAALEYTSDVTLFLPRHDGTRLTAVTTSAAFSAARLKAESVMRALIGYAGDGTAASLGGSVRLALYGANPVEVSGGVATVNLAASALQLDRRAFHLACQAIANTLTELPEIHYACVQVVDKQLGLDLASTLPTGAFSRSVGTDVGAAYEQALSQRVAAGEDASGKRLSSVVALYFPLSALDGVVTEARSVSFTSQALPDMIVQLLRELSEGPRQRADSPALPLLSVLLAEPPTVTEPAGGAGKQVTLRFDYAYRDMLEARGVSLASGMASLCYTLTTFLPNLTGLTVYIGSQRIDTVTAADNLNYQTLLFSGGLQRRADYAAFLLDDCTLYFTDGEKLVRVARPVAYYQTRSPRFLLLELAKGPRAGDSVQELQPILPANALTDAGILGISLSGETLAVNLAQTFSQVGRGLDAARDRLLAYALVNTLLRDERASRLCFFVGGEPFGGFTGEIDWTGYFYPNRGIVRE